MRSGLFKYRRLGTAFTLTVLVGASLAAHARFHRPPQDPHVVAVNTRFGGPSTRDMIGSSLQGQEEAMQRIALAHPNTLILFPESIIPTWNPTHDLRWAATFAQLKSHHTGLLISTTIPVANTQANRNVLLSRGYTERLSYVQRVPVPLGMWHFGDRRNGFPDLRVIMDDVYVRGDRVEYHWTLIGTNTGPGGTGRSAHIHGFESWQIGEDELIASSQGCFDQAEYLRQLGE